MIKEKILNDLKQLSELDAYSYDGSYELMREIIASYSKITDYSICTFRDANAIYLMAIGTWKINVEKKKEYISLSNLPDTEKQRLYDVLDDVWDKACRGVYEHRENNKPTIGMFGTGFYSFEKNLSDADTQQFIHMLTDISILSSDDEMFNRAEKVLNTNIKGLGAASASVILHCLKPYTFPILNSNAGNGNIFEALGLPVKKTGAIENYISNCRIIKQFRDANLPYKNYRILDRAAWNLDKNEWLPSLSDYDPGFSKEQWKSLVSDPNFIGPVWGRILAMFYSEKDGTSCTYLSKKYGDAATSISGKVSQMLMNLRKRTGCALYSGDSKNQLWPIAFQYRESKSGEDGNRVWKLRKELYEALSEIDIIKYLAEDTRMPTIDSISKNTILYGPPGTGKTYNTVIYTLSIIENKSLGELRDEAASDYTSIKDRYDKYLRDGRIAFTTFHQSYGYEEFIEGIKPIVSDNDHSISYEVVPGVFKCFCDKASKKKVDTPTVDIPQTATIWKTTIKQSVLSDCHNNDRIRIDFESGDINANGFENDLSKGDVIITTDGSRKRINGIAIVTGDETYFLDMPDNKMTRDVQWLVKNINIDITGINSGKILNQMTAARVPLMKLEDLFELVKANNPDFEDTIIEENQDPYVFIIDEINRGNISKIFGELITLLEETKRSGQAESMSVTLPYSGEEFTVPDNIYILGTMNTADRSIAIMDTALRRRFSFVEMLPDTDVLRNMGINTVTDGSITVDVADMLDIMNERIAFLYDREHTIGHAFFTPLKNDPSLETLGRIFEKSIIPLLQEYFYEDYGKIQLILGDDGKKTSELKQYQFIRDEEVNPYSLFNTPSELESVTKYTIQNEAFYKINSYKLIDKRL